MRKLNLIPLLLAMALVISMFAGCGKGGHECLRGTSQRDPRTE